MNNLVIGGAQHNGAYIKLAGGNDITVNTTISGKYLEISATSFLQVIYQRQIILHNTQSLCLISRNSDFI